MKKLVFAIISGAVLVAAPLLLFQEKKSDFIYVVGRRASFVMNVLTYAPPGANLKEIEIDRQIEANVIFSDSKGRFAAVGHGCDCPPLGYGFLKLPRPEKRGDHLKFDLSYRQASLFVNRETSNGLFGWLQKPVPGLRCEVGVPEEGSAAVLVAQKVGMRPQSVPCRLVEMTFPGENLRWYIVTGAPVLLPGASGSPVVQVRHGRLYLVGAVRETIGSSLGLPGYVAEITPSDKLLEEVSKL